MRRFMIMMAAFLMLFACAKKNRLSYSGTAEGTEIRISSRKGGEIKMVADEGDKVQKGDLLAKIDCRMEKLKLDKARYALVAARENQKSHVKAYDTAAVNTERIINLYREGSVSKSRLDEAETQLVAAKSRMTAGDASASVLEKDIDILKQQIEYCSINAPQAGAVTETVFETGEYVNPGAVICTVTDIGMMKITFYVPEKELIFIKEGMKVGLIPDAAPDSVLTGIVEYVSHTAEFTPKNIQTKAERLLQVYRVTAYSENPAGVLRSGMHCDVTVGIAED